jgi:hypothetical protein
VETLISLAERVARRRELLDDLAEIDAILAELAAADAAPDGDPDHDVELVAEARAARAEHSAWLQRQRAGLLVVLTENDRALLACGAGVWESS